MIETLDRINRAICRLVKHASHDQSSHGRGRGSGGSGGGNKPNVREGSGPGKNKPGGAAPTLADMPDETPINDTHMEMALPGGPAGFRLTKEQIKKVTDKAEVGDWVRTNIDDGMYGAQGVGVVRHSGKETTIVDFSGTGGAWERQTNVNLNDWERPVRSISIWNRHTATPGQI
jgi:hypothetical protein